MPLPGKKMAVFGRVASVERHLDWYRNPPPRLAGNLARGRRGSSRMIAIGTKGVKVAKGVPFEEQQNQKG
jgi:hypothetical protein